MAKYFNSSVSKELGLFVVNHTLGKDYADLTSVTNLSYEGGAFGSDSFSKDLQSKKITSTLL